MDLKTLQHVLKYVNNRNLSMCLGIISQLHCSPYVKGIVEENNRIAGYLEKAIKRTEKKLNKEKHDEVPNRPGRRPQAKKRKTVPGRGR